MPTLVQDLRYALRTLLRSPGFTTVAVLTLALGIGASTAVFTVVDSVILKPLAYHDSGKLVVAWEHVRRLGLFFEGPNPRHFDVWQKRLTDFTGLTLLRHGAGGLTLGMEHPRLVGTVTCLPNLFDVLQVTPLLGRTFLPEDGIKGRDDVAILTYPLWQSLLNGDTNVIGKTIRVADTPRQVIGVLPPNFAFPNANALRAFRSTQTASRVAEPAVFLPAALNLSGFSWDGEYGNWIALARLKPEVSIRQAEAQLNLVEAQIAQQIGHPGGLTAAVQAMQEAVVGNSKTGLWLLMAAVIGLLLIACLNLANAQVGRALSRQREAAVRAALGAAKWRLVWSALGENMLLAILGGVAGILLARAGLSLFRHYSPLDLPRLSDVHLNLAVLLFAVGLAFGSSVLSGMLPAIRLLHIDPQTSLQQGNAHLLGSRRGHQLRTWLIGLEVFGCTVLLFLTGLFSKSLLYLLHQDKGFETAHVAIAEVRLSAKTYGVDQDRITFDDAVLSNLRVIPGVQAAGLVSAMPLEGQSWIEGLERADRPKHETLINLRWISPGYFETTREKLLAGRWFEERDRNMNNAVLSEGVARALWQSENPVGGQIRIGAGRTFTVIGVVGDARSTSLKTRPAKMMWLHYKDRPPTQLFFMARGVQPADALIVSMRQAIWKYAPDVTIARVQTMDSQVTDSLAPERFQTFVLLAFAIAALLLAMLGIYGVLSYSVSTRKQEIGVRMALGSSRGGIYVLTLGEASMPVLAGIGGGLIVSILAGRLIRNLLYGTRAVDPLVMLIVTGLFLAAAVAAAFLPARRAAHVDPMVALRHE